MVRLRISGGIPQFPPYAFMAMTGTCLRLTSNYKKGQKSKAVPLQAWTGPEGSRKLRLPDFKTIGT